MSSLFVYLILIIIELSVIVSGINDVISAVVNEYIDAWRRCLEHLRIARFASPGSSVAEADSSRQTVIESPAFDRRLLSLFHVCFYVIEYFINRFNS